MTTARLRLQRLPEIHWKPPKNIVTTCPLGVEATYSLPAISWISNYYPDLLSNLCIQQLALLFLALLFLITNNCQFMSSE